MFLSRKRRLINLDNLGFLDSINEEIMARLDEHVLVVFSHIHWLAHIGSYEPALGLLDEEANELIVRSVKHTS